MFLNERNRLAIFNAFINSNFTYCPLVWMFCGKKNSVKLEKIQERALRIVYNDKISTYYELLDKGDFLSVTMLRIKCLAVEMYRCVRGLNPEYLNDMYAIKECEYALRDCSRIQQSKFKTYTFGYKSFQYYGAKVWNSIPIHVKNSTDLSIFKQDIDVWCRSHEANALSIC